MGIDIPSSLNIGSGGQFAYDKVNIDIDPRRNPDIVADLSAPDLIGSVHDTERFGRIELRKEGFSEVIASEILEHIRELSAAMRNCLDLLRVGGEMKIVVPYDLSLGAWQDPTHVRAFNENSWKYYTEWFWYMGWDEARFDVASMKFVLSPAGASMAKSGVQREELLRTPRAVDYLNVVLRKRALTPDEVQETKTRFQRPPAK